MSPSAPATTVREAARPGARRLGRVRRVLVPAGAVLGVLAVLAVALWSVTEGDRLGTGTPGELVVGSGVAHVDRVVSAARPQHAMPGMGSDDDPVATGRRRVSVELTLRAEDGPLRVRAREFTLRTRGGPPMAPHRSLLPDTELPEGTTLSGVLVFDVPQAATDGELAHGSGDSTEIALPVEEGVPVPPTGTPGSPTASTGHDPAHPSAPSTGPGAATSRP